MKIVFFFFCAGIIICFNLNLKRAVRSRSIMWYTAYRMSFWLWPYVSTIDFICPHSDKSCLWKQKQKKKKKKKKKNQRLGFIKSLIYSCVVCVSVYDNLHRLFDFQSNQNELNITKTCLFKYTENFTTKKWKISNKNSNIFHISAENIDCGYSLEPPRRGGSNEYPQSMFSAEIRKIMYTPINPSFTT